MLQPHHLYLILQCLKPRWQYIDDDNDDNDDDNDDDDDNDGGVGGDSGDNHSMAVRWALHPGWDAEQEIDY